MTLNAPGEFAEIDGRKIHFIRKGQGAPVVVFESGLGGTAISWRLVQDAVAEFTETISWDRRGYAWSDPAVTPPDLDSAVSDLARLLEQQSAPGPYVLVGHSLGGFYVRRFAMLHPDLVAGMVQVDPSHERMQDMVPAPMRAMTPVMMAVQSSVPTLIGAMMRRSLRQPVKALLQEGDGPEQLEELLRFHTNPDCVRAQGVEMKGVLPKADVIADQSLGDIPLVVLGAGKQMPTKKMRAHRELQLDQLAALSTRGSRKTAERSGHLIPFEQPEAVVEAVREVVDAVRSQLAPVEI